MNSIEIIENNLGYIFNNKDLCVQAITHSSYSNEHGGSNYERLEFLGDAIIELVVSNFIYSNFDMGAGELSKLRAKLVSTANLSEISRKLKLHNYVNKSNSLSSLSKKTTADLFESIIGAVYVDGGFDKARDLILKFVIINKDNVDKVLNRLDDAKSTLQELLQKDGLTWEYRTMQSYGLDHEKTFVVALFIDEKYVLQAEGKSLHLAQTACAKMYLNNL